ncbi:MAG: hypothetical protein KDA84_04200 [Planctomycetaceae bacterium]|nr:hypothetical protein [Planctomycetaceae bacterium]
MRSVFIAMSILSVSGCGTLANVQGMEGMLISAPGVEPVRVYGGVRKDFELIAEVVGSPETDDDTENNWDNPIEVAVGIPLIGYFAVVDPVLSFVGDTITLPYVLTLKGEPGDP